MIIIPGDKVHYNAVLKSRNEMYILNQKGHSIGHVLPFDIPIIIEMKDRDSNRAMKDECFSIYSALCKLQLSYVQNID